MTKKEAAALMLFLDCALDNNTLVMALGRKLDFFALRSALAKVDTICKAAR